MEIIPILRFLGMSSSVCVFFCVQNLYIGTHQVFCGQQQEAGSHSWTRVKGWHTLVVLSFFKSETITARAFSWTVPCPPAVQQLGWELGWGWESSGTMAVEAVWLWRTTLAYPGSPASQRGLGWSRVGDRGHSGQVGGLPLWSQSPGPSGREGTATQWGHGHLQLQAPSRIHPY